uniref:DUF5801 repeats-in-toxin domain-containing protein n=1 Tax=Roseibium sp. TaxID=1936156 RepID=UPI0035120318
MSTENNANEFIAADAEALESGNNTRFENASISSDSYPEETIELAQANSDEIVPVYAGEGANGQTQQAQDGTVSEVLVANAQNQVFLPANVSLDNAVLAGSDLLLIQPDGSVITIQNAALNVPTFILDNVEIPQETLVAALGESGINIAAGPGGAAILTSTPDGSGGNFFVNPGDIGDAGPILGLLDPTSLQFPDLTVEELFPDELEQEAGAISPLTIVSIVSSSGTEIGVLEDPDLDAGGTNPGGDGERDQFIVTIQAGSSNVTNLTFNPDNGNSGPLSLITSSISGASTTANFTYELSADGHTLTIFADGAPVVVLVIEFEAGVDDIASGTTGEIPITVTLLEGFPHQFASDVDAFIEGIRILAEDANGFTDIGAFSFTVVDDVPAVSAEVNAQITADLDEGDQDASAPSTGVTSVIDTGTITKGNDPDVADTGGVAIATSGSGAALINLNAVFGADGAASVGSTQQSFTFTSTATGLTLTDGSAIILVDAHGDGSVIVGQVSGGAFDGQAAFALSINPDTGLVTLEQYLSLAHPDQHDGSASGSSYDEFVDLSGSDLAVFSVVTDGDGDAASVTVQVGSQVRFFDDGPLLTVEANSGVTVALDEGNQDASSPSTGVASVIGTAGSVVSITKGDDPDVANTGGAAISSAVSSDALVDVTSLFGADGAASAGSVQYALSFTSSTTGLTLTDGSSIALVDINGDGSVIVGQVSGGTFNGQAAFALSINPDTGVVTVEQYLSLAHPDQHDGSAGGSSYDEAVTLVGSDLSVEVTITDGDGDKDIGSAPVGGQIEFRDDGPSVSNVVVGDAVVLDETNAGEAFASGP